MQDKVVIITGGSSGIGEATAQLFAEAGAQVVITYKSNESGAQKVAEKTGALAIQADLRQEQDAQKVITSTIKKFGKIDILINNAGRYISGDEWNGSAEIFQESLSQNLISVMNMSKYALEIFLQQQSGVIVSVASRYSTDGQYDAISYAAAKAGIANITQAYAKLLAPFGRANCVSPSAVRAGYWLTAPTEELNAQNNLIEPNTVAEKIFYLASDEAKEINGQNIFITK